MAYVTPRTWVAGETVNEDQLNEQIRDNEVYLKAAVDTNTTDIATVSGKLDDVSQAQPSRVIGTIYQNTGGKIRLVTISVLCANSVANHASGIQTKVGSYSPPTTITGYAEADFIVGFWYLSISFIVLPNYYYKAFDKTQNGGITTLQTWTEWDIH